MKTLKFSATVALITAAGVAALPQAPTPTTKPNIVFILVDNLGYGELGVYGVASFVESPPHASSTC
jgi:hypothetical protein